MLMKSQAPWGASKAIPTMLHRLEGDVAIIVHADVMPTDADWDGYVNWLKGSHVPVRACLVVTDGPGPNPEQRARLAAVEGVEKIFTAVVTGSIQARGIVTAFSWFGLKIRAFKPSDLDAAFAHLGVPDARRRVYLEQVASFRAQLAGAELDDLVEGVPTSEARETARHTVINERLERVRARVEANKRRHAREA